MSEHTLPAQRAQLAKRTAAHTDGPSYLFLLAVAANVVVIVNISNPFMRGVLVLVQALLLVGCQEAKHLCVHGTFLRHRWANNAVGAVCAALVGINFFTYRHFHFQHHRATCTTDDPEGQLYKLSWRTRWIWPLAPLEVLWVAYHINKTGWSVTPLKYRGVRNAGLVFVCVFAVCLAVLVWEFPLAMLWAYAIPLVLSSWISFLLTQAEHYGVAVVASGSKYDVAEVTNDIVLPVGLGWLTLHGSLHRMHHCHPGLRWFQAPAHLRESGLQPMTYAAFARCWLKDGPRLWIADSAEKILPI